MGYVAMLADDMSWNHKHMGKKKKKNIDCILVSRIISAVKRKLVILWWK